MPDSDQDGGGTTRERKPARDGEINEIPDVNQGDKIRVETIYSHQIERNLTVSSVERDDVIAVKGYGTEYVLSEETGIYHTRVYLQWDSRPEGAPVAEIEVLSRGEQDE